MFTMSLLGLPWQQQHHGKCLVVGDTCTCLCIATLLVWIEHSTVFQSSHVSHRIAQPKIITGGLGMTVCNALQTCSPTVIHATHTIKYACTYAQHNRYRVFYTCQRLDLLYHRQHRPGSVHTVLSLRRCVAHYHEHPYTTKLHCQTHIGNMAATCTALTIRRRAKPHEHSCGANTEEENILKRLR